MKSFKKSFYDLISSYKSLPYLDEYVEIEKDRKKYRVKLKIEKIYDPKKKPTHKTVESLIRYMKKNKDIDWKRCDDPSNDPPLFCFSNLSNVNYKFCSISVGDINKSKLSADQIMTLIKLDAHSH